MPQRMNMAMNTHILLREMK